jgi:CheY-like chemotaxis protein
MADSAADAMKQLRDKLPDVLVSDIGMPEVDGFELATQIRRNDAAAIATLPLVALTAYASVADRDRARAHGFDAYATKPLEPDQLIRTIVQALRRRGTPGPAQP